MPHRPKLSPRAGCGAAPDAPARGGRRCVAALWGAIRSWLPGLVLVAAGCGSSVPSRDLPDVVLVVLDTVRWDGVRLGGRGPNATPGLDALSRDAVIFDEAFSTHDSTPSSHFSLFTGWTDGLGGPLDHADNSLARQLARVGYRTLGVSANGNVSPETLRTAVGFEAFVSLMDRYDEAAADARAAEDARHAPLLARFGAEPSEFNRRILASGADSVLRELDALLAPVDAPRFVFVNVIDAHDPFFPTRIDLSAEPPLPGFESDLRARALPDAYTEPARFPDPRRETFLRMKQNVFGSVWRIAWDLSEAQLARYRSRYLAEVRELDAALATLWDRLRDHGLLDGIVVVTSDHGECFGEAGYVTHSFRDRGERECSMHVPLFIRAEGAAPRRVSTAVSGADIAPTIYDILGIDDGALRDASDGYGRSLRPELGVPAGSALATAVATRRAGVADRLDARARERLRSLGYIE